VRGGARRIQRKRTRAEGRALTTDDVGTTEGDEASAESDFFERDFMGKRVT
jgi:hypothetical protein